MKGRKIEEMGVSSRGMYMCNIADIIPKWKDIRIADIIPNGSYLCSNVDIPKLYAIPPRSLKMKMRERLIKIKHYPIMKGG